MTAMPENKRSQECSAMSYPFLIDLKEKANLLEHSHKRQQEIATEPEREMMEMAFMERLWLEQMFMFNPYINLPPPPPMPNPRLELVVKRDDFFGTSVRERLLEMLRLPKSNLQKPLMVIFEGEMGIDEGALSVECPTNDTAMMCGLLFGLSLFNNALVPLPAFPQLLYAKLLGKG
ncbi:probable E3 ubiquitin-protein ligase HERC3 [Strongylocentrotus purpuratus]|uniref:Uncharacterized protein n=1 Tax=Strongylocentrotus purpuratus TaxID=7668 RepID=A0A7M7NLR2_STRPU|nr:probable E3 ubiquitin-protein ligase HERC3 [Strongylocentrotus purpuratus]